MWILAGNLNAKLSKSSKDERNFVADYLTFTDAQSHFKGGDGTTCLLNTFNDTFPSGLVPMVRNAALKAGLTVKIIDKRSKPCSPDPQADLEWLRDYQLDAVQAAGRDTRGIIWVPTGGGKGEIIKGLIRHLPCNWLFIVHRGGLVGDIANRFTTGNAALDPNSHTYQQLGDTDAGLIGDGKWEVPDLAAPGATLTCATFQTLAANMKKPRYKALIKNIDAVCIDECHTLPAQSFWRVAMSLKNAYYRIALSGTPLARGDKRSLFTIAASGPVIYRVKADKLIKEGILARPKIKMLPCYQESKAATWQGAYGELVVRSTMRNRLLTAAAKTADKPCLLFVKEIKHGKALTERLLKAGLRTEFVWGSDSQSSRDHSVERLIRDEIDVLVCSVVFQEGVDIPSLASVIIGSGGKSVIATLQRIGRGMRNNQGAKKDVQIFDIMDKGNKWLEEHARGRRRAYLKESHEVQIDKSLSMTPLEESKFRLGDPDEQ